MKFKGKNIRVILVGEAKEAFEHLLKITAEEREKGIKESKYQTLLKSLKQKVDILKHDPMIGTHIQKGRIPEKYERMYDVTNLWKLDLSGYWRMIYTIKGTEIDIISVVLDIVDHQSYDKIFGYRKR